MVQKSKWLLTGVSGPRKVHKVVRAAGSSLAQRVCREAQALPQASRADGGTTVAHHRLEEIRHALPLAAAVAPRMFDWRLPEAIRYARVGAAGQ